MTDYGIRSGSFRPCRFGLGLFRPGAFWPWVISANFGGSFRPDIFCSPRLRMIGRTIIWLFDEESIDVKSLFFKSLQARGDR